MKKVIIMLLSVTLAVGASAQGKGFHHGYVARRVIVIPYISYGFGLGYPYLGYPYYPYGYPYGYPYYYSGRMPYRLSMEIQTIRDDYKQQIKETRRDKSISHAERRKDIQSLKIQRDQAIINAERNYRPGNRNRQNNSQGNNNNSQLQNSGS
jgi:hypothetical protein